MNIIDNRWTKESWEEACCGYQDEVYLVAAIRTHLQTQLQRKALYDVDLSIEDCLNGRYTDDKALVVDTIYKQWNAKLGWREFGF